MYSRIEAALLDEGGILRGVRALAVHPRFRCFPRVFLEERLDLKSLKGRTKAEELRKLLPQFLSLRPPLKAL